MNPYGVGNSIASGNHHYHFRSWTDASIWIHRFNLGEFHPRRTNFICRVNFFRVLPGERNWTLRSNHECQRVQYHETCTKMVACQPIQLAHAGAQQNEVRSAFLWIIPLEWNPSLTTTFIYVEVTVMYLRKSLYYSVARCTVHYSRLHRKTCVTEVTVLDVGQTDQTKFYCHQHPRSKLDKLRHRIKSTKTSKVNIIAPRWQWVVHF